MTAIPYHVALVDVDGVLDPLQLVRVATALGRQVQVDFEPAWKVSATVVVDPDPPTNTWRLEIRADLGDSKTGGFHLDERNQPYAIVDLSVVGVDDWSITASHELLEMLADPWGNRLQLADAPDGDRKVPYLVEVCDPC